MLILLSVDSMLIYIENPKDATKIFRNNKSIQQNVRLQSQAL